MQLDQETYDALYADWVTRHPESDHFVLICSDCHVIAQPEHDCAPEMNKTFRVND